MKMLLPLLIILIILISGCINQENMENFQRCVDSELHLFHVGINESDALSIWVLNIGPSTLNVDVLIETESGEVELGTGFEIEPKEDVQNIIVPITEEQKSALQRIIVKEEVCPGVQDFMEREYVSDFIESENGLICADGTIKLTLKNTGLVDIEKEDIIIHDIDGRLVDLTNNFPLKQEESKLIVEHDNNGDGYALGEHNVDIGTVNRVRHFKVYC